MRVTDLMMVDHAIQHMTDNMEALSNLQERASTGKLIRTPADDPSVAVAGLSLRSTLATHAAYQDTANTTSDWLDANELAFGNAIDLGTRALNLAKEGLSDTQGTKERQAIATDIEGVIQNAVAVANSVHQGKYIFAGYYVNGGTGNVPPFQYTPGSNAMTLAPGVATTNGQMSQSIERGQSIQTNWDGLATLGDLVQKLAAVRNDLSSANFSTTQLNQDIGLLDGSVTNLATNRTTNGDRVQQVNMATDRMAKTGNALKNLLSHKEDANLAETISLLNHQQVVYQAVLAVGQRAVTPSLFDYLK